MRVVQSPFWGGILSNSHFPPNKIRGGYSVDGITGLNIQCGNVGKILWVRVKIQMTYRLTKHKKSSTVEMCMLARKFDKHFFAIKSQQILPVG